MRKSVYELTEIVSHDMTLYEQLRKELWQVRQFWQSKDLVHVHTRVSSLGSDQWAPGRNRNE